MSCGKLSFIYVYGEQYWRFFIFGGCTVICCVHVCIAIYVTYKRSYRNTSMCLVHILKYMFRLLCDCLTDSSGRWYSCTNMKFTYALCISYVVVCVTSHPGLMRRSGNDSDSPGCMELKVFWLYVECVCLNAFVIRLSIGPWNVEGNCGRRVAGEQKQL